MSAERAFYASRAKNDDADESEGEAPSEMSYQSADIDRETVANDVTSPDQDAFEERLKQCFENMSDKNAGIRVEALSEANVYLRQHYIPDILSDWHLTFADNLERSSRKGNCVEVDLALRLVALLVLQTSTVDSEAVCRLTNTMKAMLTDGGQSMQLRARCATSLGICAFGIIEEPDEIISVVEALHSVWTHTKIGTSGASEAKLFCAALSSWALLVTAFPKRSLEEAILTNVPKVCAFLGSPSVDIRICAGETLALLYELAESMHSVRYEPPNDATTLATLQRLSTESTKHIGKKDKRNQRATFRDIHAAVKNGTFPDFKVKFGNEVLTIDSWTSKTHYDMFCCVLAGGMSTHLKVNAIIRDVFVLGPPVDPGQFRKIPKTERKAINEMASRARRIERGKNRHDKRIAELC
uniref:Interferon-related developmental regulator N-terminal domain-containing protein n=1 Tax=Trichuris muris TaxID=70415 RepID=A0A5S6QYG2_TRIMR